VSHADPGGSSGGEVTVGVDIGSTSVKAVAVDAGGTIVERVRLAHPLLVPAPDRLEHDADRAWRRAPQQALRQLTAGRAARAVAVSSMVPSLTAVDAQGRPIAPGLLYGDARGGGREREPGEVGDGREMVGFLRWLAGEVPAAAGYWPAPAVANHALGGVSTVDITTAFASMPLFGPEGWDDAVCRECGTSADALPEVAMMGVPIGTVSGTGATLAAGAIDAVCEQLVSGAEEVGDVLVLCGTTLITWIVAADPGGAADVDPVDTGLWAIPHTTPDRWLVGGPSNAGGLFLGWASRLLARPAAGGGGERLDPGRIPVWSPYVRGERTPLHDPDRRAAVHDLDLTHGPAALRRAAWEASGFVVRHHIDLAGLPARRVVAVGGATRIDGAMQALADATGLDVHVAAVPEGAALGAAYLARMAWTGETDMAGAAAWARTGRVVEPDPAWVGPTAARYQRFRALADGNAAPATYD
jgi:xylulokinase